MLKTLATRTATVIPLMSRSLIHSANVIGYVRMWMIMMGIFLIYFNPSPILHHESKFVAGTMPGVRTVGFSGRIGGFLHQFARIYHKIESEYCDNKS